MHGEYVGVYFCSSSFCSEIGSVMVAMGVNTLVSNYVTHVEVFKNLGDLMFFGLVGLVCTVAITLILIQLNLLEIWRKRHIVSAMLAFMVGLLITGVYSYFGAQLNILFLRCFRSLFEWIFVIVENYFWYLKIADKVIHEAKAYMKDETSEAEDAAAEVSSHQLKRESKNQFTKLQIAWALIIFTGLSVHRHAARSKSWFHTTSCLTLTGLFLSVPFFFNRLGCWQYAFALAGASMTAVISSLRSWMGLYERACVENLNSQMTQAQQVREAALNQKDRDSQSPLSASNSKSNLMLPLLEFLDPSSVPSASTPTEEN